MSIKEESVFIHDEPESEEIKSEEIKSEEILPIFEEIVIGVELNIKEAEILDLSQKSLTEIFLENIKLYNENNLVAINYFNKIGVVIKKNTIDIIQKIINDNPTLFNEIETGVLEILKDNKIDSSDIPQFILIVQILYERIYTQKNIINSEKHVGICLDILKIIVRILVKERNIFDKEKKIDYIFQLDKLIESCISLLNYQNVLRTPKLCCSLM
jgi:hypothetical protein